MPGLFRRAHRTMAADEACPAPAAVLDVPRTSAWADRSGSHGCPHEDCFRMTVVESSAIAGRGTLLTGTVDTGSVRVGDVVEIASPAGVAAVRVTGIERAGAPITVAAQGDHISLLAGGPFGAPAPVGTVVTRSS